MDEGFYPPNLEEYHIGFRYEQFVFNDETMEEEWKKFIFPDTFTNTYEDGNPNLVEIFYSSLKSYTRVKYPDEQDIIELGWVRDEKDDRNAHIAFTKGEYLNLYWCSEDHEVVINEDLHGGFMNDVTTIFMGKIKNFNEMQRLMKQIGIES